MIERTGLENLLFKFKNEPGYSRIKQFFAGTFFSKIHEDFIPPYESLDNLVFMNDLESFIKQLPKEGILSEKNMEN
jgi:hypothetical protein